jgi:hypothetical protein
LVTVTLNPFKVLTGAEKIGTIAGELVGVAALICNVNVAVAVSEFASPTVTVMEDEPVAVGVPEITPLLLFRFSPVGKVPEVRE